MGIPAIVTAGDSRAAKAVYGKSKVYLEIDGLSLVAHVVRTLQDCPEVDAVWVVGDTERLEATLGSPKLTGALRKPLHIVPQQRDLISNAWETYRRVVSGDVTQGRDPNPDELDTEVFLLSGDMPLATAQEFSTFIKASQAANADYALGLCPAESLDIYRPEQTGGSGISVAYFNVRDGRFRQNNLHYARPARIGRLDRIEEMYELRHQRRFWNMFTLAIEILASRVGGFKISMLFSMMHFAGVADRNGLTSLARLLARAVTLEINRSTISKILDTRFTFIVTESGGCGLDVDTEEEYDVISQRFTQWSKDLQVRSIELHGPSPREFGRPEAMNDD